MLGDLVSARRDTGKSRGLRGSPAALRERARRGGRSGDAESGNWNSATRSNDAPDSGGCGGGPSPLPHGFGNGRWAGDGSGRLFRSANLTDLDLIGAAGALSSSGLRPRSWLALSGLSIRRGGDASTSVSLLLSPEGRSEDEGDEGRYAVPSGRLNGRGLRRSSVSTVCMAVSEEASESERADLMLSSFTALKGFANDLQQHQNQIKSIQVAVSTHCLAVVCLLLRLRDCSILRVYDVWLLQALLQTGAATLQVAWKNAQ